MRTLGILKLLCLTAVLLGSFMLPMAALTGQASAVSIFSHCGSDSAGGTPQACQGAVQGQGGPNPVIEVLKVAIEVLAFVVGVASVVGIVVSGIRFIVANGDSSSIATARSGLIYSLVGVAVAILSQALVVFVLDKLNI